jgi:hypothetical protein
LLGFAKPQPNLQIFLTEQYWEAGGRRQEAGGVNQ